MVLAGKADLGESDVENFDLDSLTDDMLIHCFKEVLKAYNDLGGTDQVAKGRDFTEKLIGEFQPLAEDDNGLHA